MEIYVLTLIAVVAAASAIRSHWQSSKLCDDLAEARKPLVVRRVADLAAAVAELEQRQQTQHGRLWGRLGALERKVDESPLDLPDDDLAPTGETDEERRSRLRRELLPKSMAGKVAKMREGLNQE